MTKLSMTIGAAAFALGLIAAPAFAGGSANPTGTWQVTSGETRFQVEMCGDGTQLCATLVWLRDDVKTPANMAFLNKRVIDGATQAHAAKWQGDVVYDGSTYAGNITMIDANTLRMAGCAGIACESMVFNRV
jgi:uncharacterized protein (DUF2147 family)